MRWRTARPACSSRMRTRRRSPRPSGASWTTRSSGAGSGTPRRSACDAAARASSSRRRWRRSTAVSCRAGSPAGQVPPSLPVADGVYERAFIFEMAGPTLDFLDARRDALPNIRRFLDRGAWSRLGGPLQPGAPQSFATLLTGMNPGATGLFDTFRFAAGGYDREAVDARSLHRPCLHEVLSQHGKRVGLLNVPLTVPLRPVNGVVVSG